MREDRGAVVILPDEFLQKLGMVGQMVKDLRGGQAVVAGKLFFEVCHTFNIIICGMGISLIPLHENLAFKAAFAICSSTPQAGVLTRSW